MLQDFHKAAIITPEREISYAELMSRVALYARHTPKEKGARTVIIGENRPGWVYALFSVWQNDGIAVPVDATATVSEIAYILADCRPQALWVSRQTETVARQAARQASVDVEVNIMDDGENAAIATQPDSICSSRATGEACRQDVTDPTTALIIYTSGTTGSPKGVMLSFANLYTNIDAVSRDVPIFAPDRRTMVLLPTHHVLPLVGTVMAPLVTGGGIAICPSMTGPDIMATLQRGKVGILVGVPRLWQTLYTGIKKKIDQHWATRLLFALCEKAGSCSLSRIVFRSVHQKMGGHLDYCVSGGAALDAEIGRGLRTLGLDVLEGYGMTETAPMITFTRPGDIIPGCSGLPLPCMECRIIDGEMCVKGPNVMQGYYNRPEETAQVIDKDGFLHTGDLARFDDKGRVYITGRTKEIIVLSNGKNVQPSELEYKLEHYDAFVKEAAVVQDGDRLRAIIVPADAWGATVTDKEAEQQLKREVLEPYNLAVSNYKKIMSVTVCRSPLPRTRLDKLQRYKLRALISTPEAADTAAQASDSLAGNTGQESCTPSHSPEFAALKAYIEREKRVPVTEASHIETDLAMDSLDRVSLQEFIEQTFGVTINADDMAHFASVGDIASDIAKRKTRDVAEETDIDWHTILATFPPKADLPKAAWTYPTLRACFRSYFSWHNSLRLVGVENIPENGPFILAPNHQSYIDGPLAVAGLSRGQLTDSYFYATEDHVRGTFTRFMARHNNVIVMERKNLRTSIQRLAEVLREGKNVVIFPEGSRTHDGSIGHFRRTVAILSREMNVPVIPVRISGAYEALPRGSRWVTRHPITVTYLSAIMPQPDKEYDQMAEAIRSAISCEK